PVRATIRLNGSTETTEAESAWVIVAPPDFAPPIENIITLYDVVYNIAVALHPSLKIRDDTPVSFTSYIYPILRRVSNMHWVSDVADRGHGPGAGGHFMEDSQLQLLSSNNKSPDSPAFVRRNAIFQRLRKPFPPGGGGDMPRLPGGDDERVSLTEVQYKLMERWAKGEFTSDWTGQPTPLPLDKMPVQDRPGALDRAALEACVGGGFFPGIEASRVMREQSTYDKKQPFRINQRRLPGELTAGMAVPWQADFHDCSSEFGADWWPGQRPVQVFRGGTDKEEWILGVSSKADLVNKWSQLGFVVEKKKAGKVTYVESERSLPLTQAAGKG
ncbi:MAG: LodA/GoxA family CTQ-dependent oxidase, partial [Acidobacteriota bacterium]|nr:LodA/GoxA family CTQ-dependent oxidase [Acidobacteriota bacterium]